MKEALLHYVWKTKSFPFTDLQTTENENILIDNFGIYNLNAGPDFLQGKIRIQNTQWVGHIEIHVMSSDWIKHNHEIDPAYENVILHVVWEEDEIIYRKDGTRIPCIELKSLIPYSIIMGYNRLAARPDKIPCASDLRHNSIDQFYLQLNRMYVERLEEKCYPISIELEANKNYWAQSLFTAICRCFGLKVNSDAMDALSKRIPVTLIAKHNDNLFQLEALLYGQAGMLSHSWNDTYPQELIKEFKFLKSKYQLTPMNGIEWKLARMRPTSFPTIRISQLANLYFTHKDLHADLLTIETLGELKNIFNIKASEYWEMHHLFDKTGANKVKKLGKEMVKSIIINGIIPFLFAYGQFMSDDRYIDRALKFAEEIEPEKNKIIREWNKLGIQPKNALESQGILNLYKNYCLKKRCLECAYGNKVLKQISQLIHEETTEAYA